MSSAPPPTEYFPGINFNPSFYNLGSSAVSLEYLQSNYLRSTGYAISRAQFTIFNGTVDINDNLDVSGNINASEYLLNGVPVNFSQWTTSGTNIYYNTGNVGIGKTNPSATYKLDVSGNINADKIFRAGTELTQYTDTNVRTVLSTSAGTNMTWNTGTNKFDVAAPYTDTNTRTVLSTSAGTNMTWNTGTNKFDVSVPPSYTDTNTRTVLSTSAGTNMTWNTGTNKFDVAAPYTDTNTRTVLSTSAGTNMTWNTGTNKFDVAVTSYTLPIASNGILGGVKPDVDTIIVNPSTGLMSLSGNDIFLNGTANRAYGWLSSTSALGRAAVAGSYSTNSVINDVVLRSANNLILQSGVGTSALFINTSNQAFFRNALCIAGTTITAGSVLDITGNSIMRNALVVGGTTITSGYTLDVKGDVITSGNINLANTSRSLFWGGTNSNLGRAGVVGEYSTSSAINDIVLRSGNRLLLQSGVGVAGLVINTDNNVAIGAIIPLTKLDVSGNLLVRAYGTTGSGTRGLFFRSDHITTNLQYNCSILTFDHGGGGPTDGLSINGYSGVSFTSGANTRQERMRIWSNGAVGIQGSGFAIVNNYMAAGSLSIGNLGQNYGGGSGWTSNTAGLMLECADVTEIAVHDSGNAVHSFMYYTSNGNIRIGRNMGWGAANVYISGNLIGDGYVYGAAYVYSSGFLQGAGGGGAYRIVRPDNWVRLRDPGESTHLDFAAGRLYAHNQLDVQGVATFNNQMYLNSTIFAYGSLLCRLSNISSTNTDYVCVSGNTAYQSLNDKFLYIANGTFTGFHRNYTNDELFDVENPEIFKNSFVGYIVISSGKIKTDYSSIEEELIEEEEKLNNKVEWKSAIDKEGIFIEDALPIIKLSRVKKDKRVFGVLGDPKRNCNSKERLIVNSVGEGAICVCNTNGNIENGDYIQSSDVLGHGEKQDDDILHNYTVAKATIDCNFELNSPYYECIERPDGIRTAFIACTYHCG